MPIRILPDAVASQIAAGEVVERPASVVKELLENALDAHARAITIRVEKAGQRLIEISDDGEGIPSEELSLSVARHATSKLNSAKELFSIRTLGFRGEALASIASVSRLTLTSGQAGTASAARLVVDGGRVGEPEQVGAPQGTTVRVEDLFYNVPARLKFLKSDATERGQITNLVSRYAVAYPNVRFQLFIDGHPELQTSAGGDRREVLAALYGVDIATQMLEIILEEEDIQVGGFTSTVGISRGNRRDIIFFVNGRWVVDPALSSAVIQAYRTLLMVGRYPICILFIDLPADQVDVNVHPAKSEVRFRNSDRVFTSVQRAIRRGLLANSPVPEVTRLPWMALFASKPPAVAGQPPVDPSWSMAADLIGENLPAGAGAAGGSDAVNLPAGSNRQIPILRLIGQVGSTYLVAEGPDGLYLIDQHAAHERVLYEKLTRQIGRSVASQALLAPDVVHFPPQQAQLIEKELPILSSLGFQVELFGANAFRILAIPSIFTSSSARNALQAVVDDFEEDETPLQHEYEKRLAARICKRLAIKGGQSLTAEEQAALLCDLEGCESPRTCPHGRPTMIHLSVDLLERQFGRRAPR